MKVTTSEQDFGTRGLTEAYQRLDDRLNNPDVGDPLVSFVETLEWCYALEEHLRHRPGEADDKYFAARDTDDPDGQTLAGLILRARKFRRTLVTLARLVDAPGPPTRRMLPDRDRGGGVILPGALVKAYRWKPLVDLPPPQRSKIHSRDRFYELHVQGRPIMGLLAAARRFLLGLP